MLKIVSGSCWRTRGVVKLPAGRAKGELQKERDRDASLRCRALRGCELERTCDFNLSASKCPGAKEQGNANG